MSREYFSRVKKKSFLITTILVPVVIVAFWVIIIKVSTDKGSEAEKLAVVDEAGLLNDSTVAKNKSVAFIKNETEGSFVKKYKEQGYNAFLYVPKFDIDNPKGIVIHSKAAVSPSLMITSERMLNKAIEVKRMNLRGVSASDYEKIGSDISPLPVLDTNTGTQKSTTGSAYLVSFACGILIYMMMIIYGTQVMRGVSEEKTNRIAEVIVSSVKPFQLMLGKILGIGAVGLTQFAIWIVIGVSLQVFLPGAGSASAGDNGTAATVAAGIASLPLLKIGLWFLFYFLGGYLTYASLFAAIGSMATDDQQDTQQLVFPVLMPIILGFVIMTKAISDPHSGLAVFGSLFPLTSPVVMMGRITYDIPWWQMASSAALLIGCFLFLTWVTGKVYRTGILMYGKKPSWKEMLKWAVKG